MKKGFTLVELLAVIVILSVVSLMVFPNVIKIINEAKDNLYQTQLRELENTSKKFAVEHPELLDSNHLNPIYITLDALKKSGYLEVDKISNPKTSEEMNGCVKISYNDSSSQYHYIYEEIDCTTDNSLTGYIITYNNGWIQTAASKVLIPAYDKILEDNKEIIHSIGGTVDGLYDMGEEYVFRGENPNNYVKIEGSIYRIISMNKKNKTIKLISKNFKSSAYNTNSNNTSFIESSIKDYLLEFLETNITNFRSKLVEEIKWKNGKININDNKLINYDILKSIEGTSTVSNKLGLINVSDYAIASLDDTCYNNVYSNTCTNKNYLKNLFKDSKVWTMNGSITENNVITIDNGTITDHSLSTGDSAYRIYPVLELKTNIYISNDKKGTSETDAYIFN